MWAFLPAVCYFVSLPIYITLFAPRCKSTIDVNEWQSHVTIALTPIANLVLQYYVFVDTLPLRFGYVVLGTVLIDTVEYWAHRLLHNPTLYAKLHNVHHGIGVPHPTMSFVNHSLEIVFTTLPILLSFLWCGCSFSEYTVATALAFVATIADHVSVDPNGFHTRHHCVSKRCNFQQPFGTYWDHLCSTYDPLSSWKIPFRP